MPSIPKNTSLYEILHIEKSADAKLIKTQYRKLALKFHPDKQSASATDEEKQQATEQFQQLGIAYSVLSDPAKRSHYDTTGSISTDDSLKGDKSWSDYFKELWTGVVNEETINNFAAKYKGSDEERKDLLAAYKNCSGDMNRILEVVECSDATDGERFADIIKAAVKEKQVGSFPAFAKTTTQKAHQRRLKEQKKHQDEFEKQNKSEKKKDSGVDDLKALIQARQMNRVSRLDAMVDQLAQKAGKSKPGKSKRANDDQPTEEEFQRIQAEMMKRKMDSNSEAEGSRKRTKKNKKTATAA
ncbi:hypothetical protein BJV82DRAFT_628434 [Fennellomyces sp. T-0311]|nr:hypothetical protein BJV82DRAFT_628434 [Fennellomyces sp. T-0311]